MSFKPKSPPPGCRNLDGVDGHEAKMNALAGMTAEAHRMNGGSRNSNRPRIK